MHTTSPGSGASANRDLSRPSPLISTFDPDYDAAYGAVAQSDKVDDALALMQAPPNGGSVSKQIMREMAIDPAMAMANIALQRRQETHESGIAIVFPVLQALGFPEDDLRPHLAKAQKLFAKGVAESQKVLDDMSGRPVGPRSGGRPRDKADIQPEPNPTLPKVGAFS